MSNQGDKRIAIVHDELTRRGGAEVVFEELARIWPAADLYALYAGEPRVVIDGEEREVQTSFLQRFPIWWRRHPSRLVMLLPQAAEQFDLSRYDVVISSSSGFAKSIVTRVNVPHICYCHTPTRYVWDAAHEVVDRVRWPLGLPARLAQHYLRLTDFAASQRVDRFVANSTYTQQRISHYYRRDSEIVYPPIDTVFYSPQSSPSKDYFVCVGRLTPAKHFEQAALVCEKLGLRLVIIGNGSEKQRLRRLEGNHVQVLGSISREELREKLRGARALLQPGVEDFGMASAEALSSGIPVIAYGRGGVKEIVEHGVTGILYDRPGEEALAEAIRQFLEREQTFVAEKMQSAVLRYTRARFAERMGQVVDNTLAEVASPVTMQSDEVRTENAQHYFVRQRPGDVRGEAGSTEEVAYSPVPH